MARPTTQYKIVDVDGDIIDTSLIKPGEELPVKVKSVLLTDTGDLIITLEYQHGGMTKKEAATWTCPKCGWIEKAHSAYGWAQFNTRAVEVHQTTLCPERESDGE